jgi:prophage regulatory protein
MTSPPEPRFLKISDVAEELSVTNIQVRSLIKSGELSAIQVGGRGQWRIERVKLEEYIAAAYARAEETTTNAAESPGDKED